MSDVRPATTVEIERVASAMTRVVTRADRARRRRRLPPAQILLSAPGFEFASGARSQRFHAASVAKMMTATRIFQLAETGALDLEAPLTRLLPDHEWRGLFVHDGVDGASRVTPLQLLSHTSGVADYFSGRSDVSPSFTASLAADRARRWTPDDLLDFTREHQSAVGPAGKRFSYSDTGYVLLGRIIEEAGGATLGAQLHAGIFRPAGMAESCLLFHTRPGGTASHGDTAAADLDIASLWVGRDELSRAASISCDWGGGGVVTTLDDLRAFLRAWSDGRLLSPSSRVAMRRAQHRFRTGLRYGAGAMEVRYGEFSPFLRGLPHMVGHLGVTATHAFTVPELDLHIVMNFHSTREMLRSFHTHIRLVRLLQRAIASLPDTSSPVSRAAR